MGFPGRSDGKESPFNAGDLNSIPGSGRSQGVGNGNPPQYSCLENHRDRVAWWAHKELDMTEQLTLTCRDVKKKMKWKIFMNFTVP